MAVRLELFPALPRVGLLPFVMAVKHENGAAVGRQVRRHRAINDEADIGAVGIGGLRGQNDGLICGIPGLIEEKPKCPDCEEPGERQIAGAGSPIHRPLTK